MASHPPPITAQPMQPGYPPPQYAAAGKPPRPAKHGAQVGQPGSVDVWMPAIGVIPKCPPGLEYLTRLDQLLIKQESHMLEVIVDWECANKYNVLNNQGQQCYYAFEESNIICRQCCGPHRGFKIQVADNNQKTIFQIKRPFNCFAVIAGCNCFACLRCAQDEVSVEAADGTPLGFVRQACSCIRPHYTILDHNYEPKFDIMGPLCPCTLCNKGIEFPVRPIGSSEIVAKITKQWSGIAKELFTDSDNFGITFPMDLDVKLKATLVGCVFLIDFMYFEDTDK